MWQACPRTASNSVRAAVCSYRWRVSFQPPWHLICEVSLLSTRAGFAVPFFMRLTRLNQHRGLIGSVLVGLEFRSMKSKTNNRFRYGFSSSSVSCLNFILALGLLPDFVMWL